MGFLIALIVGGLAGWLASIIVDKSGRGVVLDIVIGVVGAFIANILIAPLFGVHADITKLTLLSFGLDLLGSIVLLLVINFITRRNFRG